MQNIRTKVSIYSLLVALGCGPSSGFLGEDQSEGDAHEGVFVSTDVGRAVDAIGRSDVIALNAPVERIGLLWDGTDNLEVRFERADGTSSAWLRPEIVFREEPAFAGHVDSPGGVAVQFRVLGGFMPSFLRIEEIHTLGPAAFAAPRTETLDVGSTTQGLAEVGTIFSRSDWGAAPPRCSTAHSPNRATIHHAATPNNDSLTAEQRLRQIQSFHQNSNGWCDFAYQYAVSLDGRAWVGIGGGLRGTHVGGNNTGNIGVVLLGDFRDASPSDLQLCGAARILSHVHQTWPEVTLDADDIKGHRDYRQTTCPGTNLYQRLPDVIAWAADNCFEVPPVEERRGLVQGVVFDASVTAGPSDPGNLRLPNAVVEVVGEGPVPVRAGDAYWSIELPPGDYELQVRAEGYEPYTANVSLSASDSLWASAGLVPVEVVDPPPDDPPPDDPPPDDPPPDDPPPDDPPPDDPPPDDPPPDDPPPDDPPPDDPPPDDPPPDDPPPDDPPPDDPPPDDPPPDDPPPDDPPPDDPPPDDPPPDDPPPDDPPPDDPPADDPPNDPPGSPGPTEPVNPVENPRVNGPADPASPPQETDVLGQRVEDGADPVLEAQGIDGDAGCSAQHTPEHAPLPLSSLILLGVAVFRRRRF